MLRKLPFYTFLLFVIASISLIVFQITFVETNKKWEEKTDKMIQTVGSKLTEPLFELIDTTKESSVYEGDPAQLSEGIMRGYIDALPDRFSMFMDEDNYQDYLAITGSITNLGIGVSTIYDETMDGMYIINVYRTSPAEQAGIVPGDLITNVNGTHVKSLGYYSAMRILGHGNEGETIKVTVKKHDGTSRVYDIARSEVVSESIVGEKLDGGVGLIRINRFGAGDDENFKKVLESLIKSGREKFVIDVRNNPGGNIETISSILDFILPEGPMFSVSDKSAAANTSMSDTNALPYPIAVLVNENTVCGAEVFAASLKKSATNVVVGTKTYGKASTQNVIELALGGAVCLSTGKITMYDGEDFDGKGILPQVEVELPIEAKERFTTLSRDDDVQLQAAIEQLKKIQMNGVFD